MQRIRLCIQDVFVKAAYLLRGTGEREAPAGGGNYLLVMQEDVTRVCSCIQQGMLHLTSVGIMLIAWSGT